MFWEERIGYAVGVLALLVFAVAVLGQPDPLGFMVELVRGPDGGPGREL